MNTDVEFPTILRRLQLWLIKVHRLPMNTCSLVNHCSSYVAILVPLQWKIPIAKLKMVQRLERVPVLVMFDFPYEIIDFPVILYTKCKGNMCLLSMHFADQFKSQPVHILETIDENKAKSS